MTPALLDLARRAVASRGWDWLEGVRLQDGARVMHHASERDGQWCPDPWVWGRGGMQRIRPDDLPDLADPATLGAVEHGLLPDGWVLAMEPGHGWGVIAGGVEWVGRPNGANPMSKAAALVAALEAL